MYKSKKRPCSSVAVSKTLVNSTSAKTRKNLAHSPNFRFQVHRTNAPCPNKSHGRPEQLRGGRHPLSHSGARMHGTGIEMDSQVPKSSDNALCLFTGPLATTHSPIRGVRESGAHRNSSEIQTLVQALSIWFWNQSKRGPQCNNNNFLSWDWHTQNQWAWLRPINQKHLQTPAPRGTGSGGSSLEACRRDWGSWVGTRNSLRASIETCFRVSHMTVLGKVKGRSYSSLNSRSLRRGINGWGRIMRGRFLPSRKKLGKCPNMRSRTLSPHSSITVFQGVTLSTQIRRLSILLKDATVTKCPKIVWIGSFRWGRTIGSKITIRAEKMVFRKERKS